MRPVLRLRTAVLACLAAAPLALTGCGSSHGSTDTTGTSATTSAMTISGQTPSGDRVFTNPRYSLALPSGVFHYANTGSTGREVHTYGLDHDFAVTAIYDPHPVSIDDAVAAARAGGAVGLTGATSSVRTVTLSGASEARLVAISGTSSRTGKSTSAVDLIALTAGGGMVTVEVVSAGPDGPAPGPIADSVRLTG